MAKGGKGSSGSSSRGGRGGNSGSYKDSSSGYGSFAGGKYGSSYGSLTSNFSSYGQYGLVPSNYSFNAGARPPRYDSDINYGFLGNSSYTGKMRIGESGRFVKNYGDVGIDVGYAPLNKSIDGKLGGVYSDARGKEVNLKNDSVAGTTYILDPANKTLYAIKMGQNSVPVNPLTGLPMANTPYNNIPKVDAIGNLLNGKDGIIYLNGENQHPLAKDYALDMLLSTEFGDSTKDNYSSQLYSRSKEDFLKELDEKYNNCEKCGRNRRFCSCKWD